MFFNEENYTPTGDPKKDYLAYTEIYGINPLPEILYGINVFVDEETQEDKNEENIDSKETSSSTSSPEKDDKQSEYSMSTPRQKKVKPMKNIFDLQELDEEKRELIQSEICIRCPQKSFSETDIRALSMAIEKCKFNLSYVVYVRCNLDWKQIQFISKALEKRNSISIVHFEGNSISLPTPSSESNSRSSTPTANSKSDETLSNNSKKTTQDRSKVPELSLSEDSLSSSPFYQLFLSNTKHLVLRDCGINDNDISSISSVLATHSSLLSINLWGNEISDEGAIKISEALRTNIYLLSLSLARNTNITDRGVKHICQAMEQKECDENEYQTLSDLMSSYNSGGNSSSGRKKQASKKKKNNEWENQVTKTGDKKNPQYIVPGNSRLASLNLNGLNITDDSISSLLSAIQSNENLQRVALGMTGVSSNKMEEISQALDAEREHKNPNINNNKDNE